MSEDLLSVQAEIEEYCRSSAISLDQIIKYYYEPMLLECKNDPENFPLNEEEIHQTFTNLGFVLNWNKRFCKVLEACEKDTTKFIDTLQQYLTLPEFGTESEFGIICTEYAKNYRKIVGLLEENENNSELLKKFLKTQFEKNPSNTIQSGLIWPLKAPVNFGMLLKRLQASAQAKERTQERTEENVNINNNIREKIGYVRDSVDKVAIEVNKTFPLNYHDESYYKSIIIAVVTISIVGAAIYLFYNKEKKDGNG